MKISWLLLAVLLHIPVVLTRANASRGRAPRMPDGGVSFAFYGAVDRPGEARAVQAAFRGDQHVFVELLVPALPPERDLSEEDLPVVTITAPSGAETVLTASRRETFDDPHSAMSYLTCVRERFPAEEGTYAITVSAAAPARFALAVGDEERPGAVLGAPVGSFADVERWYRTEPAAFD